MNFKFFLGVDISKEWFNYCLRNADLDILQEGKVNNCDDDIFLFIKEILLAFDTDITQTILLMEHTGIYSKNLNRCWHDKGGSQSLVQANKVSSLLGIDVKGEGKTDTIDARRLSEYAVRFSDKIAIWQPNDHQIELLQHLQRQRKRLLDVQNKLNNPIEECIIFETAQISKILVDNQNKVMESIHQAIVNIEHQMDELIKETSKLKLQYEQIKSVEGIGPVTAKEIIIATRGFTKFNAKQAKSFANACAVTLKEFSSGKKTQKIKTTKKGNSKLKSLLTMGALSLIGTNSELGRYYQRKIEEGKKHMVVINAMRNKIIKRAFAVVRNNTMYQRNLNICLE